MSKSKLTTAQIEAELKKIDERLCVTDRLGVHRELFVYIKTKFGFMYYLRKTSLKHRAKQVWFDDEKINSLSDKILEVMDRWDGVLG